MTIRTLTAAVALSALAPFAAYADAPSGDFSQIFETKESAIQTAPQFPRSEYRNYVEFSVEQLVGKNTTVTVEQVRREIARMPLPVVGA